MREMNLRDGEKPHQYHQSTPRQLLWRTSFFSFFPKFSATLLLYSLALWLFAPWNRSNTLQTDERRIIPWNLLALVSAKDKSRKKGGGRPKRMGRSNDCRGRRWRKFGRSCCRVLVFFFAKRNWAAVRELRVGGQSPQLCKDLRLVSARRPHGRCVCQWAG